MADSDTFVTMTSDTLDMILKLTATVYDVVDAEVCTDSKSRDKLNCAALAIDNGLIEIATVLLVASFTSKEAKIVMGLNGDIHIEAETMTKVSTISEAQTSSPSPAIRKTIWVLKLVKFLAQIGALANKVQKYIRKPSVRATPKIEEL